MWVKICGMTTPEAVTAAVEAGVDAIGFVFAESARLQLPAGLGLLPVVREADNVPASLPRRILFEGPVSGTGVAGDWIAAHRLARCTQLVLAGGLNTGNVAAAIAAVQPFGVDVSS